MVGQGSDKGPFFTFAGGSFLTHDQFVREVRAALAQARVHGLFGLYMQGAVFV